MFASRQGGSTRSSCIEGSPCRGPPKCPLPPAYCPPLMSRLAWLTDIHLNFVTPPQVDEFLDEINSLEPDAVLLGGDIGDGTNVVAYLSKIADRIKSSVYFVLGNHDFYGSS